MKYDKRTLIGAITDLRGIGLTAREIALALGYSRDHIAKMIGQFKVPRVSRKEAVARIFIERGRALLHTKYGISFVAEEDIQVDH